MRSRRPGTTRRRARIAAASAAVAAAGFLLALPAHAAPPLPQVHPVDTTGGVLGVPRGTVPPVGTPDLQDLPGLGQLPGVEIAPLPPPTG